MEHVRLPLLSQEYLVQRVEEEPLLKTDLKCKDYLIEALKYHLLKGDQKISFKTPRTKPRQPVGLPKVIIIVFKVKIHFAIPKDNITLLKILQLAF